MKAKNNNDTVPHPLREVWAWKNAVYRAIEGMPTSDALKLMHTDVAAVRKVFGLYVSEPREVNACVAEAPTNYGEGKRGFGVGGRKGRV